MQRILAGIDGSPAALDALRWAADLAQRTRLELLAVRVFGPTQAELPPDQDTALHDQQQQELDQWCSSLPAEAQPVRSLLVDGDPPNALLGTARDEHADLLVVGGRGAGGFADLHLGSVAHHLTHHTTIPLAIVPRTGAVPIRHLVIGVDGSPGSVGAAEVGADLGAGLDVPVTASYAFEPFAEWVPESDPDSWRRWAEAEVRSWAAAVEKAGLDLEVDVDRDLDPVAAIARAVDTHPGSAAVVGTRGLGGFSGLRLGKVPLQLVHHTGSAVILVPPAES